MHLQLSSILLYHGHYLLHHLGMSTWVDRQPRGRGEVRVLLQGHSLVQVVLEEEEERQSLVSDS